MTGDLLRILRDKKVLILGFGKEGMSSYRFLIRHIPAQQISVADQDTELLMKPDVNIDNKSKTYLGSDYLDHLDDYDLILKTPGISKSLLFNKVDDRKILSQTDLFLKLFSDQIIGITGTKGKSTTSSLIFHILSAFEKDAVLVGNIGIPPFDHIENISKNTRIVFELSSFQLQDVTCSPAIAVLLNLFEEHLDNYNSVDDYYHAKFHIARFQQMNNWFIVNGDDKRIKALINHFSIKSHILRYTLSQNNNQGASVEGDGLLKFQFGKKKSLFKISGRKSLPGEHNQMNIMAAICACKILDIPDALINSRILDFPGLRHRLEYIGKFMGIHFYNDSIATIPEATIHALRTLKNVDTIILGGKDRGIDYSNLVDFLARTSINNIVFTGNAGKRIMSELSIAGIKQGQKLFFIEDFRELPDIIKKNTQPDGICLLSPAASSYDQFKNFEERGDVFRQIAESL